MAQWGARCGCYAPQLTTALDLHGRAVAQHFTNAAHDLRGVIANANDGVGAALLGVLALLGVMAYSQEHQQ